MAIEEAQFSENLKTQKLRFWIAFPAGVVLFIFLAFLKLTTRMRKPNVNSLPQNAVVFMSHADVYLASINSVIWKNDDFKWTYLGDHSFLSYSWYPWQWIKGQKIFRLARDSSLTLTSQICNYLNSNTERLWLASDSGGPYGQVRASLIKIATSTGRPMVAFGHSVSHYICIYDHKIPLPFATITPKFSEAIRVSELELKDDALLEKFQSALDEVGA